MVSNLWYGRCYNWLWLFEVDYQLCLIMTPFLLFYIYFKHKWMKRLFYCLQLIAIVVSVLMSSSLQSTKKMS